MKQFLIALLALTTVSAASAIERVRVYFYDDNPLLQAAALEAMETGDESQLTRYAIGRSTVDDSRIGKTLFIHWDAQRYSSEDVRYVSFEGMPGIFEASNVTRDRDLTLAVGSGLDTPLHVDGERLSLKNVVQAMQKTSAALINQDAEVVGMYTFDPYGTRGLTPQYAVPANVDRVPNADPLLRADLDDVSFVAVRPQGVQAWTIEELPVTVDLHSSVRIYNVLGITSLYTR